MDRRREPQSNVQRKLESISNKEIKTPNVVPKVDLQARSNDPTCVIIDNWEKILDGRAYKRFLIRGNTKFVFEEATMRNWSHWAFEWTNSQLSLSVATLSMVEICLRPTKAPLREGATDRLQLDSENLTLIRIPHPHKTFYPTI